MTPSYLRGDRGSDSQPSRQPEFLRFLKQVAKTYPRQSVHLVCDRDSAHHHPAVRAWLASNPRIALHVSTATISWLNLVEVLFSLATGSGSSTSVKDAVAAIRVFLDGWDDRCHPFSWTKPPTN